MREILVACATQKEGERGLRLAADLSVASGARVSLVCAVERPVALAASAGLDAIGHLSTVALTAVSGVARNLWLRDLSGRVFHCWQADRLPHEVSEYGPSLVIACNRELSRELIAHTEVPVWHPKQPERSWFDARKIRCAVRGTRALDWARTFASSLGAELETTPAGLFGSPADLRVIDRKERTVILGSQQPLVVV